MVVSDLENTPFLVLNDEKWESFANFNVFYPKSSNFEQKRSISNSKMVIFHQMVGHHTLKLAPNIFLLIIIFYHKSLVNKYRDNISGLIWWNLENLLKEVFSSYSNGDEWPSIKCKKTRPRSKYTKKSTRKYSILKGSNKLEILVSWTITWHVSTMIYHALFPV